MHITQCEIIKKSEKDDFRNSNASICKINHHKMTSNQTKQRHHDQDGASVDYE